MKYNTRGIALSYIKYGESSIISKIFTEERGLQNYIIKGVRYKKTKKKLMLFEPLQLLQINASYFAKKSLQHINEITLSENQSLIFKNIKNKFMLTFVAEVLSKSLLENEKDEKLFDFVWGLKLLLVAKREVDMLFPLDFLLKLSHYFGFPPSKEKIQKNTYFDMQKGMFVESINQSTTTEKNSRHLKSILLNESVKIPYAERTCLLHMIFDYYTHHGHELKNMKSHLILKSLQN